MPFLTPRAVPVFVTILLLMAVASSGVMSAVLPCANSLAENPFACDGVIVYKVDDRRYSVGMWAAAFMAGVIGSSGNLILVPYLSRFRGIFTSAYFAGTGVSGIVASALALAQVWKTQLRDPNFGVDVFCAFVAASCSVSLVAWLAIVKLDYDYDVVTRKEERAERRRGETVSGGAAGGGGGGQSGGAPRSPARPGVGGGGGCAAGGGGRGGRGEGGGVSGSDCRGEASQRSGSRADAGDGGEGSEGGGGVTTSGSSGGSRGRSGGRGRVGGGGGLRWIGQGDAHHGADADTDADADADADSDADADVDPLRESLLSRQQQHHAHRIEIEASPSEAASPHTATDGDSVSYRKMLSRIWPVVFINLVAGMANYGMCVPAAAVAAEHRADIFPSLPMLASITYYVVSPFGFGLAGLLPNWAYSPAVATWVVAMGFITWAALAAAIPTALGREVQTTGLLVAIAVFGLANPYAISEGFRWCQNLHLGERPARFTAVGMQLGSALGALISFFLF